MQSTSARKGSLTNLGLALRSDLSSSLTNLGVALRSDLSSARAPLRLDSSATSDAAGASSADVPLDASKARKLAASPLPTTSKYGSDVDNCYALFARAAAMYPTNDCLGWRPVVGGKAQPFAFINFEVRTEGL